MGTQHTLTARSPRCRVATDKTSLRAGGHHDIGIFLGDLTEVTDAMVDAGFGLIFTTPGMMQPARANGNEWRQ